MNKIVKGLLSYLKKTNQESLLPSIVEALATKMQTEKKTVLIIAPCALTVVQQKKAVVLVRQLTGKNDLKTKFTVDSNLIDGLKIRLDDRVWDFSLAAQVSQLKDKLYETS